MADKKLAFIRFYLILICVICTLPFTLFFTSNAHASEAYKEGILLLANKEYQSAVDYFQIKTDGEPENATAHYYLGYSYYKTGEVAKAFSEFKRAFHLNPDFSLNKVAHVMQIEEQLIMSVNKEKTDSGTETKFENLFRQGLNSIYRKDYTEAENHFRELIGKDSNIPKFHYYLGYVLYIQNKTAEALSEFKISYSIDPAY